MVYIMHKGHPTCAYSSGQIKFIVGESAHACTAVNHFPHYVQIPPKEATFMILLSRETEV